jgi:hypothetical protein
VAHVKLLAERDRHRYTGLEDRLAAFAERFGPATCGCVALNEHCRDVLTYEQKARHPVGGWPLCPRCGGTGIDPRVPA